MLYLCAGECRAGHSSYDVYQHWKYFLCLLAWLCLVLPECFKGAVTQFWFLVHQDPPALLCRAAFLPFAPHSLFWCMGLFLSKYMALNMISLNFVRFLFVYFSRLLQSLGMAAKQHSHLVYQPLLPNICHLRTCCWHALFHLFSSLMKMLNTSGPHISLGYISDCPSARLCTADHNNHLSLAVQPVFNLLYCPLIQSVFCQCIYKKVMWDCQKPWWSKDKPHVTLFSPAELITLLWKAIRLFRYDSCSVSLCWLITFCVLGNSFQHYLVHHLARVWSEASWSVVSQIFLLALLENDTCCLPVLRNLLQSLWPFKDHWLWSHNDTGQLPQHLWVHPFPTDTAFPSPDFSTDFKNLRFPKGRSC